MFLRFTTIKNVGRFHDCRPGARHFAQKTIFFGCNGNGKSTLADIFTSVYTDNSKLVESRKTFGSTDGQVIEIIFENAGTNQAIKFKDGVWISSVPNLAIFDSRFISQNIFDGERLSDEHRSNLHRVIVGAEGRKLAEAIETAGKSIRMKEQEVNAKEKEFRVSGPGKIFDLNAFIALTEDLTVDKKIAELEAQKEFIAVAGRPELKKLSDQIPFDIEKKLSRGSVVAHEEAKKAIESHVSVHWQDQSHRKEFLSEGLALAKDEQCPFCGQDLIPVSGLIDAYRAFFDAEYKQWEVEVRTVLKGIRGWNIDAAIKDIESGVAEWRKFLPSQCSEISIWLAANVDSLRQAKSDLDKECEQKSTSIEHKIDFSGLKKLESFLADLDTRVESLNFAAGEYKQTIESKDTKTIESEILKAQAVKTRYEQTWVDFCADYADLTNQLLSFKKEREVSITELSNYSKGIFALHQGKINEALDKIGADFRVEGLEEKTDRRKVGGVHCGFKLVFFGSHSVVAEEGAGEGSHHINNTLSHGDKNVLALAFFVAALWNDPELEKKTVVMDDPVSSLDYDRKCATVSIITDLCNSLGRAPKQLLILTHDRPFLKEIHRHPWFADAKYLRLVSQNKTLDGRKKSDISDMDIVEFLMSEDVKRLERIKNIVDGGPLSHNTLSDCRPILESLMKQKYWNELKQVIIERGGFGKFVDKLEGIGVYDSNVASRFRAIASKLNEPHHASPEGGFEISDGDARFIARETMELVRLV